MNIKHGLFSKNNNNENVDKKNKAFMDKTPPQSLMNLDKDAKMPNADAIYKFCDMATKEMMENIGGKVIDIDSNNIDEEEIKIAWNKMPAGKKFFLGGVKKFAKLYNFIVHDTLELSKEKKELRIKEMLGGHIIHEMLSRMMINAMFPPMILLQIYTLYLEIDNVHQGLLKMCNKFEELIIISKNGINAGIRYTNNYFLERKAENNEITEKEKNLAKRGLLLTNFIMDVTNKAFQYIPENQPMFFIEKKCEKFIKDNKIDDAHALEIINNIAKIQGHTSLSHIIQILNIELKKVNNKYGEVMGIMSYLDNNNKGVYKSARDASRRIDIIDSNISKANGANGNINNKRII